MYLFDVYVYRVHLKLNILQMGSLSRLRGKTPILVAFESIGEYVCNFRELVNII